MLRQLLPLFIFLVGYQGFAQDTIFVSSSDKLSKYGSIQLGNQPGWRFHQGYNPLWVKPDFDDSQWRRLSPDTLTMEEADQNGLLEGCYRFTFTLDSSLSHERMYLRVQHYASVRVFINGREQLTRDHTGQFIPAFQATFENSLPQPVDLVPNRPTVIVLYVKDQKVNWLRKYTYMRLSSPLVISISNSTTQAILARSIQEYRVTNSADITGLVLLALLFWLLVMQNPAEKQLFWIALITTLITLDRIINSFGQDTMTFFTYPVIFYLWELVNSTWVLMIPLVVSQIILNKTTSVAKGILYTGICIRFLGSFFSEIPSINPVVMYIAIVVFPLLIIAYVFYLINKQRAQLNRAQWTAITGLLLSFLFGFISVLINLTVTSPFLFFISIATFLTFPASLLVYLALRIKENITTIQNSALAITQLSEEKQQMLAHQNELLEQQVEARTAELKATQAQLIQKEKLASLGELTAGIAHEIQNPLNFVNNFSEVSAELVSELEEEQQKPARDTQLEAELLGDLKQNLQKINHHGQRASSIVKGMLEHSRATTGERQPTDINKLADEYLRLSYHGIKAKNNEFQSVYELIADENLPLVNVVPQEIGRVLLNLANNAFYAVNQRAKSETADYQPKVTVSTRQLENQIRLSVQDNGNGISTAVKDKIFQPFFTTKSTGEGTGLGLSLSYDIITKGHGGTIEVETKEGEGTTFLITL